MRKILVLIILFAVLLTACDSKRDFTEEVYNLEVEDGELYGILTLPNTDGPHPIALIIQGAGATNKDGNNISNESRSNCLKMLSKSLGNMGIASLRYDKRGVGRSLDVVKSRQDLIFADYIEDAMLWMEKIQTDSRFSRHYIIGHSEGGLVGAAAAKDLELDGFISIAAPGKSGYETLVELLDKKGKNYLENSLPIIEELKKGNIVEEVPLNLDFLFKKSAQPYLISLFKYEPKSVIREVDAPTLILQGDSDLQVSVEEARILHDVIDSKLVIIRDMNHILRSVPWGIEENISTYTKPKLPLHEDLVREIVEFIHPLYQ